MLKDLLNGPPRQSAAGCSRPPNPIPSAAINRVMGEIFGVVRPQSGSPRDFLPAQRTVAKLHNANELNEAALLGFAKAHQYEEAIAAISAMSGVRIATVDNLVMGERHDAILILGNSIGLEWATVRALIVLRLGPDRDLSGPDPRRSTREFRAPGAHRPRNGCWVSGGCASPDLPIRT